MKESVLIRINHDDSPEEVSAKFTEAMRRMGWEVTDATPPNSPSLYFKVTKAEKPE